MSTEGYMRESDPSKAEAMAEFSDAQHERGDEREAYKAEMQAGALYDAQKELEGLSLEEVRAKYEEAAEIENSYAKSNLDAGNREYANDVTHIQNAQRRAVFEKALHEMERAQQ